MTATNAVDVSIRPFRFSVPEEDLVELRRRIEATRWPDKETIQDRTQGVQLAKLRPLMEYWGAIYDWRRIEAKLNSLPQFITMIDGLDIQFAHVRSARHDALPMLMTHGWPGSIIELLKIIEPLTDPTAHGGAAEDAFHLVLPTLPGYGYSGKPTTTGWSPARMATAFHQLMLRLGYTRYVSQGGDWGRSSRRYLPCRRPADCSPSTPTCQGPCHRTSFDTSANLTWRLLSCRSARGSPMTSCCASIETALATLR